MTTATSNVRRSATGHRIGECHHRASVPDATVERIRAMHTQGVKLRAIALWCGVSYWFAVDVALYRRRTYPSTQPPIRVLSSGSAAPLRPSQERSDSPNTFTDCEAIRSAVGAEARPKVAQSEGRSAPDQREVLPAAAPLPSPAASVAPSPRLL